MSQNVGNGTTTLTEPDIKVACVYALSGTYGALPRFLYYATLILAIFGRSKEWLVIGALVSSLAYAATSAIHVMALVTSKSGVFDLDSLGAWAILSTAALSYIAMIHWSSTIRNSKARLVMVLWGSLIGIALVFNRATLYDQPFEDFERPCYSSDGALLTSRIELEMGRDRFNCSYACFNLSKPMRGKDEIIIVPHTVLDSEYFKLSLILVGPIMYAAYAAISWDTRQHTPSQMCTVFVMKYLNPRHKEDLIKIVWNASMESWYGGYLVMFHFLKRSPWSARKVFSCTVVYPWMILGLVMDILCLPLIVLNIILNELNLLRSGLPINEASYNVGQWSPLVNSTLVLIAAIISRGLEVWEERKAKKKEKTKIEQTNPAFELRRIDTDATLVDEEHTSLAKDATAYPPNVHLPKFSEEIDRGTRLV